MYILAGIQRLGGQCKYLNLSNEQNKPAVPQYPVSIPEDKRNIIFAVLAVICLFPFVTPPVALLSGIIVANIIGQPTPKKTSKITKMLLQCSVVGLGFGMNLQTAAKAGTQGLWFTIAAIGGILLLGYLLGKLLKTDSKTTSLVSSGTAICGGSAIAAVAPIIQANEKQISIALGIVFILNSIALFIFPAIGHYFALTQDQFGLWSAIAIHDTSSVVGAASRYAVKYGDGVRALEVATTVKLARALWIIPVSIAFAFFSKKSSGKIKIPYFILWFIVAMTINTYFTPIQPYSHYIKDIAKAGLTATLFLIGSGLSLHTLRAVGFRPLLLGIILWVVISVASLWAVIHIM